MCFFCDYFISGKNLFRKLNEHSKNLQDKQQEIIKKHNSLVTQYEELEHLKVNMYNYLDRNKTEKKRVGYWCNQEASE